MSLFDLNADHYLEFVKDWNDPNPKPIIKEHNGFLVVRDDLLGVGSKVRGLDYLIGHDPQYQHVNEWVFGSCPATGYAQISLPYVCSKYGKKAVLFMAKRNPENYHEYQKQGMELGAIYKWVNMGMLTVTQKRAKDYAEESNDRTVLPIGLEHPTVIGSFIKVARSLEISPKRVWTVGSSGTLNRSLQLAWPSAEVHVVSVGHKMSVREIGNAVYHRSDYKFDHPVKGDDIPPYPSAATYDAKLWHFVVKYGKQGDLIWNVA